VLIGARRSVPERRGFSPRRSGWVRRSAATATTVRRRSRMMRRPRSRRRSSLRRRSPSPGLGRPPVRSYSMTGTACISGATCEPPVSSANGLLRLDMPSDRKIGSRDRCSNLWPRGPHLLHRRYIRLYFGPLPPSRGVHRGPSTSVALQSTQFGAFTRRVPCVTSYTPAGHIRA